MQQHADQRPARPLLAVDTLARRDRHQLAPMQERLRPAVAEREVVVLDQVLMEMLGGEAVVAFAVELLGPIRPFLRDPLGRRLAQPTVQ